MQLKNKKPKLQGQERNVLNDLQAEIARSDDVYEVVHNAARVERSKDVASLCEQVIAQFWNTTFTYDIHPQLQEIKSNKISDLTTWERESRKNPLFAIKVPWRKWQSVNEVMNLMSCNDDTDVELSFPESLQRGIYSALDQVQNIDRDDVAKVIEDAAIRP
jgi:Holliday junction resolvase